LSLLFMTAVIAALLCCEVDVCPSDARGAIHVPAEPGSSDGGAGRAMTPIRLMYERAVIDERN
jgi:hypothetical protein